MAPRGSLLTEQQARTLRALRGRTRTRTGLAEELSLTLTALDARLHDLEAQGYALHDAERRYRITRAGEDVLERHTRRVRAKYGRAA